MSSYFRYTGEVRPRIPASAPLAIRLPREVYALDGLGQLSPEEVRRGRIVSEISRLRRAGKADAEIREHLLKSRDLPRLHPCADAEGNNACSRGEIEAGFTEVRQGREKSVQGYLVFAAFFSLAWFVLRRKK